MFCLFLLTLVFDSLSGRGRLSFVAQTDIRHHDRYHTSTTVHTTPAFVLLGVLLALSRAKASIFSDALLTKRDSGRSHLSFPFAPVSPLLPSAVARRLLPVFRACLPARRAPANSHAEDMSLSLQAISVMTHVEVRK